jgi:predicted dehydrogenase
MFEKPLATSPQKAQKILDQVANSDKYCSVGFTFRFTNWALQLKEKLLDKEFSEDERINLSWYFMADHFRRNIESWKMDHTHGGGAIRFYGIHVIALLAEWGYDLVVSSGVETQNPKHSFYKWTACFKGPGLPHFLVSINSRSNSSFFKVYLRNDEQTLFEGLGPFDPVLNRLTVSEQDARCTYLTNALQEFIELSKPYPLRIEDCTKLWQLVEAETIII